MSITRKQFCGAVAGAGVFALLPACGGGDDPPASTGGTGSSSPTCGAAGAAIVPAHGHELSVPAADLDSRADKVYGIAGTAGHDHEVSLTPAHFATLKAGGTVTLTSTSAFGHDHQVTVSCTP